MKKFPSQPDNSDRFIPPRPIGRPRAARLEGFNKNRGIKNTKKPKGTRGS